MLPQKILKKFTCCNGYFSALYDKFSGKFCLNLFTLILSASPNMMHFVRTFLIMRAGVRLIAIEEIRSYGKILYTSKTFLKMCGGRMRTPHPTPLDPPSAISFRNHQKNLACFSHLTPLVLFLFTKKQSQKG